jgi:hypothetical protein
VLPQELNDFVSPVCSGLDIAGIEVWVLAFIFWDGFVA